MNSNTLGRIFRLTTYGESHGPGLGGVVDGCPAGIPLEEADLQKALNRRRPGQSGPAVSPRQEKDQARIFSGIFEGHTTGTPIAFHVENNDQRSGDYDSLSQTLRPGHADLSYEVKYGRRDYRGGGRSSGRETLCRVAGGAIAEKFLESAGVSVRAYTLEVGGRSASPVDPDGAPERPWFSPDPDVTAEWNALALSAKNEKDSLGGLVRVEILGLPAGLGEPVFDKLDARLAYAMMGVGSVKGVEIGQGFAVAHSWGSENNDPILPLDNNIPEALPARGTLPSGAGYAFASNNAGGILGGISTGAPIVITCAIKPIASIGKEQRSIGPDGTLKFFTVSGRHDISAIPRIVPVLRAMAALTAADFLLLQRCAVL